MTELLYGQPARREGWIHASYETFVCFRFPGMFIFGHERKTV